ncbi:MAG: 3-alpha-hydroxysteroid dehydrogenase, partial [Gammaproteobacteria bacterium]|nr:3-alpha-hydroxysteroid dehydrogenase [Gammaproteobacteria bacterium]
MVLCDVLDNRRPGGGGGVGANAAYIAPGCHQRSELAEAAVKAAVGKFGKLNVLVNNASIVKVTNLADCPLD